MTTNSPFQFSIRSLLFATMIVGLNAAAAVSGSMWLISFSWITTSVLVSIVMVVFFRYTCVAAARIAFICCVFQGGLYGAFQSICLLMFAPDRARNSIGLGNPIPAGIIGGLFRLPFAGIAFLVSLIVGFVIGKYRRSTEAPFESN